MKIIKGMDFKMDQGQPKEVEFFQKVLGCFFFFLIFFIF